jgi:hypothetical protein
MHVEYDRLAFAEFLEQLACDTASSKDWYDLVITHYRDEGLEEVRVRLVRLMIERDPSGRPAWIDSDREQFRRWARELMDVDSGSTDP